MNFSSVSSPVESIISDSTGVWDRLKNGNQANAASRRKLRERLDGFDRIDWLYPTNAVGLYQSLNELLSSGDNDRFILYCPLDLIPPASWYRKYDKAIDTFAELYLESWHRLLGISDVRASFIDGDVPDAELDDRPMERVVQAAYLAPTLLKRGLVSENLIAGIKTDNPLLADNLDDAFLPLNTDSEYIFGNKPLRDNVASGLQNTSQYHGISQKRANWLRWERRRKTIELMGVSFGTRLLKGRANLKSIGPLDTDSSNVVLIGMGSAIEQASHEQSFELYHQFEAKLIEFAQNPDLRNYASRTFCRLHSLGIVAREELDELGIFFPNLSGPLHSNLSVIEDDRKAIRELLEHDRELADLIYPAAIVFGSRLKGYGSPDADTDLAVFIKPGMQFVADRDLVSKTLKSKFGQRVVEYWLEEHDGGLRVRDFPQSEAQLGSSVDAHVLFGGAWEGELASISMLGEKLLKPYFRNNDQETRRVWLEEMERDALQYRLLHRGYEQFHVPRTRQVFWDRGYRMTAAKLYASQVFVPTYL